MHYPTPPLTAAEVSFLQEHRIPAARLYDAGGGSPKSYLAIMESRKLVVAYDVPACPRGHRLRNRSGNCVQCQPKGIPLLLRYDDPGEAFVACSTALQRVKTGFAQEVNGASEAVDRLCAKGAYDATDWTLLARQNVDRAAGAKVQVNRALAAHRTSLSPDVFACTAAVASAAFEAVVALWPRPVSL